MTDHDPPGGQGARLTSDQLAALSAGPADPVEQRPAVPTRHAAGADASVLVEETTGTAAAEAAGRARVDNDAPAEETSGSG